jgi:hypothetical protein
MGKVGLAWRVFQEPPEKYQEADGFYIGYSSDIIVFV